MSETPITRRGVRSDWLRTVDLARAVGISVQQVRNYEAWGFLPPVGRSPKGYRRYAEQHLLALQTSRTLIAGYGWEPARRIMAMLHRGEGLAALAEVDARHADLDRQRRSTQQTLAALRVVSAGMLPGAGAASGATSLSIGEVAAELGVRVSAIRFWESQGFVQPRREPRSGYRRFSAAQVRQLEVVILMRRNGYDSAAIRAVVDELAAGHAELAIAAAEQRLGDLAEASRRCAHATAALWAYLAAAPGEAEGA